MGSRFTDAPALIIELVLVLGLLNCFSGPELRKKDVENFYIHTSDQHNDIDYDNHSNDDHDDTIDNDWGAGDSV